MAPGSAASFLLGRIRLRRRRLAVARRANLLVGRVLRLIGVARAHTQTLQRLTDTLAALQAVENRLRGDGGILVAEVLRQDVGRDELTAGQLGVRLLGRR